MYSKNLRRVETAAGDPLAVPIVQLATSGQHFKSSLVLRQMTVDGRADDDNRNTINFIFIFYYSNKRY